MKIIIKNYKAKTILGIYPEEKLQAREILISLTICFDGKKAAKSDNISNTIDYDLIGSLIDKLTLNKEYDLIEALVSVIGSKLIKQFSLIDQVIVNIAKPNISEPMTELWKTNIMALSKFENVHCKLSGMVTETNDFCFTAEDFTPFIDYIFSCFGANRILFGSDWPVSLLAADYTKVITLILEYLNEYSAHIKSQVLGLNAIKIYNL